jgi:hypothetical protein
VLGSQGDPRLRSRLVPVTLEVIGSRERAAVVPELYGGCRVEVREVASAQRFRVNLQKLECRECKGEQDILTLCGIAMRMRSSGKTRE